MRYIHFNPNPKKNNASDCVVRMLCCVTGKPWAQAFLDLAEKSIEVGETSYEVCQKLVVYYYLYDKYYNRIHTTYTSDSEFMDAVADTTPDHLLAVIDELMDCVAVINPKLHANVLDKLKSN